jgi:hypothetical protein
MRNLYTKLGTHRRAEAVQRARDLGLLAPSARQRYRAPADGALCALLTASLTPVTPSFHSAATCRTSSM